MNGLIIASLIVVDAVFTLLLFVLFFNTVFGRAKSSEWKALWVLKYLGLGIVGAGNTLIRDGFSDEAFAVYVSAFWMIIFVAISYEYNKSIINRLMASVSLALIMLVSDVANKVLLRVINAGNAYSELGERVIMTVFPKVITLLVVMCIGIIWRRQKELKSKENLYILVIGYSIIMYIATVRIWPQKGINVDNNVYYHDLVLCGIILLCTIFCYITLFMYEKTLEKSMQNNYMIKQFEWQKQKYNSAVDSFREIRRMVHDEKKQDLYIKSCLVNHNYEELLTYVEDRLGKIESTSIKAHSGNIVIDSLVYECENKCRKLNISFSADVSMGNMLNNKDLELSIILGNILDNAFNAASKCRIETKPYVELKIAFNKCVYVISVKNRFSPEYESSKKRSALSGCGIENVKKAISSLEGLYSSEINNDEYQVIVTIPLGQGEQHE